MKESKRKKLQKEAALIILVIEICNAFSNYNCRINTLQQNYF